MRPISVMPRPQIAALPFMLSIALARSRVLARRGRPRAGPRNPGSIYDLVDQQVRGTLWIDAQQLAQHVVVRLAQERRRRAQVARRGAEHEVRAVVGRAA